jgi:hypothetical protein
MANKGEIVDTGEYLRRVCRLDVDGIPYSEMCKFFAPNAPDGPDGGVLRSGGKCDVNEIGVVV